MQTWITRRNAAVRRQRGFTLIEIMVVVAILGILAALIVPKIMSRPDEARRIAAKQDIGT
ncbi:prepilin-type N-terminal cleavage/methylation domain-containing protein, partial [Burkholderia contaminans]